MKEMIKKWSHDRRIFWSSIIVGGYLVTLCGYRTALLFIPNHPKTLVLMYNTPKTAGQTLHLRDLTVVEKNVLPSDESHLWLSVEQKQMVKNVPLVTDVSPGSLVRKSDFLFLHGENTVKLPMKHRSLWVPIQTGVHSIELGQRVDLYNKQGSQIVKNAIVIQKHEESVQLGVSAQELKPLIQNIHTGPISLSYRSSEKTNDVASKRSKPTKLIHHNEAVISLNLISRP